MDHILSVELKPPSFLFKGHIKIDLKTGGSFKLLLLDSTEPCAKASFDAGKELFQKYLPTALKIAQ